MLRQHERPDATAGSTAEPDPTPLDELLDAPVRRGRRTVRKTVIGLLVCGLSLFTLLVAAVGVAGHHLNSNVARVDVFEGLHHRPARATGPAADAVNILLLGTDRRSGVPTTGTDAGAPAWEAGAQRSDTMMLLHIDAERSAASVVSIPRDTWVDVPGHGWAKINAAYSWGGPSLAVQTIESFTGVHIDHVMIIDWSGFADLVDAVGGIDVTVPATVTDSAHDVTWTAGQHHLDGAQALLYVSQRYGLPNGDLDRIARQQVVLRTLMGTAIDCCAFGSPWRLYDFVDTVTKHVTVDSGWSGVAIAKLAFTLRHLRPDDVTYVSLPIAGFGDEAGQSVVYADRAEDRVLWAAVRDDRVAGWIGDHPAALTGHEVS
jgi:LCP family protein required for cell wall assembly